MDLGVLRGKLDEIDSRIVKLYEERMEICALVAEYKIETGKKVFDKVREEEKMAKVRSLTHNEFNSYGVTELFEQIMAMSRTLQYQMLAEHGKVGELPFGMVEQLDTGKARVVFAGAEGAYSRADMVRYFGDQADSFSEDTFRDAMSAVNAGNADFAVFPMENSTAGSVSEIYDLLVESENYIVGEQIIPVDASNATRFIIVCGQKIFRKDAKKVSICVEAARESGSLYHLLSHFICNKLNMTRMESRPIPGRSREVRFFIEFEGNLADSAVKNALLGLCEEARYMKILGNY